MANADSTRPASTKPRTPLDRLGSVLAGIALLAVMTLLAILLVTTLVPAAEEGVLDPFVPEDGVLAVGVGALAAGGLAGLMVPLAIVAAVVRDREGKRLTAVQAAGKTAVAIGIAVYLVLVSLVASQFGWLLSEQATMVCAVFAVGFGWFPVVLLPERWVPSPRGSQKAD